MRAFHLHRIVLLLGLSSFLLSQSANAAPSNDLFADAEVLNPTVTHVTGSNVGATREPGEPIHAAFGGGKSVWWIYDAQETGYLSVNTFGSISVDTFELDTVLAIYTGTSVNNILEIASNDDDEESDTYNSKLIFPVQAGTRYYIAVDGWNYDTGADQGSIQLEYIFSLTLPTVPAPVWTLPNIDGSMLSSTDFTNKVTLVNIWATWCGPCRDEIPDLVELHSELERFGFSVIGISIDDPTTPGQAPLSLVANFAASYGMNYPVVMTRPSWFNVEVAYGNPSAIPTTFVVDRQNNIVREVVGSRNKTYFASLVKPYVFDNVGMTVRREGAETVLEWPSLGGAATVQLQTATQLNSTWTTLNSAVTDDGTTASVRFGNGNGGFYRLRIN
jgi:thiol-disulfide isomerase/thioredoxin